MINYSFTIKDADQDQSNAATYGAGSVWRGDTACDAFSTYTSMRKRDGGAGSHVAQQPDQVSEVSTCLILVSGFKFSALFLIPASCQTYSGKEQLMAQVIGSCHLLGFWSPGFRLA